ncbi:PHD finger domain-containing protein [Methanobrevibacter sp.]
MSNFDFLKTYDDDLYRLGNKIEESISTSPAAVKTYATPFLERVLELLMVNCKHNFNSREKFYYKLDAVYREGKIAYNFKQKIYNAYKLRNHIHDNIEEMEKSEFLIGQQLHKQLFYISKKLYRDFSINYDDYKGVPSFKPIEIDTSDDELELINIPDFSEVIDVSYDYCVICGEPNHSNYSLCCEKCNRIMDNANNFISIRNNFGKNATFTKEDLIDYGLAEAYTNQLINSMVREKMLNVKGRFITFNNIYLDDYLKKIDNYIKICELITQFREDKITPKDMKETSEYKQGKFRQEPFYQLFKITNEEIIKKFEQDLLTTENISSSIEYTTISKKQLNRWYKINLSDFNRDNVNESFLIYNRLLIDEYLNLKSKGMFEKDIQKELDISESIYSFWNDNFNNFIVQLNEIKKDLIIKGYNEDKFPLEVIKEAGVTPKEYKNLIKDSNINNDKFSHELEQVIKSRKERFVVYLKSNDLKTSCELAKIYLKDFYKWYDDADINSDFYKKSTKILMDKYLNERKNGKTKEESIESIGIKQKYIDYWLKTDINRFKDFKDKNLDVNVHLILNGFKANQSKRDISNLVSVNINTIDEYLKLGEKGHKRFRELFAYYENNIIPIKLRGFLHEIKRKSFKKSLESCDLSSDEFNKYYDLGQNGDTKYKQFYNDYINLKIDIYVNQMVSGTKHEKALQKSNLNKIELKKFKSTIDEMILDKRIEIVKNEILNDQTTEIAAKHAGVSFDEIYDWYYKGKSDDKFKEFSEFFYNHYIKPNLVYFNDLVRKGHPIDNILEIFKINFTDKDFKIWQEDGLIEEENIVVNLDDNDDEDEEIFISKRGLNSELYESINNFEYIDVEDNKQFFDPFNSKKSAAHASILRDDLNDIEELKKEILN